MATNKGFIRDLDNNFLLPITRGELILDADGQIAFYSDSFLASAPTYNDDGTVKNLGHPGLMTAAEKAMLSSGGSGQSLSDIYTKLGYINAGLKYDNTVLSFYGENGQSQIEIVQGNGLAISTANNKITFGLESLYDLEKPVILNKFTVDSYGRISSVTGEPTTLSGITLENCTTTGTPTNEYSIVNKEYVDKLFGTVTGALRFSGGISDAATAETLENADHNGCYYKVTGDFSYTINETNTSIKAGDTLIVHNGKFVHVPSGDDITALTIYQDNEENPRVEGLMGNVGVKTNSPLIATVNDTLINLSILQATSSLPGYISTDDYNEFKSYGKALEDLTVEYTPTLNTGYTIGTLKIGKVSNTIYGKEVNLSLHESDASLVFTKTGEQDPVIIPITGANGVQVINNAGTLQVNGYSIGENSTNYLSLDGNKLNVKLASVTNGEAVNGLIDLAHLTNTLRIFSYFESVGSLTDTTGDTNDSYYYGSNKLKAAITF